MGLETLRRELGALDQTERSLRDTIQGMRYRIENSEYDSIERYCHYIRDVIMVALREQVRQMRQNSLIVVKEQGDGEG